MHVVGQVLNYFCQSEIRDERDSMVIDENIALNLASAADSPQESEDIRLSNRHALRWAYTHADIKLQN